MKATLRQSITTKWKENSLAVLFALILSFGVYMVGQSTGLLTADVLGGPQAEFNPYADIVVAPKGVDNITIFAGKNMSNVLTISMILLFDPTKVTLDADAFHSNINFSYAAAGEGKGTLVLTNTKDATFQVRDKLVDIIAPGSYHDLVVGDVVVSFADGTTETLSVELPK